MGVLSVGCICQAAIMASFSTKTKTHAIVSFVDADFWIWWSQYIISFTNDWPDLRESNCFWQHHGFLFDDKPTISPCVMILCLDPQHNTNSIRNGGFIHSVYDSVAKRNRSQKQHASLWGDDIFDFVLPSTGELPPCSMRSAFYSVTKTKQWSHPNF